MIRQAVREPALDKIAPYAAEVDGRPSTRGVPTIALVAGDFHAPHVPEQHGGFGADALATCIVDPSGSPATA